MRLSQGFHGGPGHYLRSTVVGTFALQAMDISAATERIAALRIVAATRFN